MHLKRVLKYYKYNTDFYDFKNLKCQETGFDRFYDQDLIEIIDFAKNMDYTSDSSLYRTMILLFLDSGVRKSKLINIKKDNIFFDTFPYRIFLGVTKNGRKRWAYFSDFSKNEIQDLMTASDSRYLFYNSLRHRQ